MKDKQPIRWVAIAACQASQYQHYLYALDSEGRVFWRLKGEAEPWHRISDPPPLSEWDEKKRSANARGESR